MSSGNINNIENGKTVNDMNIAGGKVHAEISDDELAGVAGGINPPTSIATSDLTATIINLAQSQRIR